MQGWVKLHRTIMNSETFSSYNAIQKLLAIYIILNANHEDSFWHDKYKNVTVAIERGQLITSRNQIVNEWFAGDREVTEQKVRTALKKFEKTGFLTIESTNNYTLLTVLNYGVYQAEKNESNQQTNHELTKSQPGLNQVLTTNKNVKNEKNVKNIAAASDSASDDALNDPVRFYEHNIGFPPPYMQESIKAWENDLSPELVIAAMKKALKQNGRRWSYVEPILKEWANKNIKTVDQARALELEFQANNSKMKRKNDVKNPVERKALEKLEEQQREYAKQEKAADGTADEEEKRKQLKTMLAKYKEA